MTPHAMRRFAIWSAVFAQLLALAAPALLAQAIPAQKPPKADEKRPPSLSREIHHQILVLPFYSVFDSIAFTLDGSKVTLTGQVLRTTLKENAEAAVKSIEGVNVVINHIEVLPVSPTDDDLRRAAYRSLYEDSTLARYAVEALPPIHIIVKNGNVTLEGSVNSESDKTRAGVRAGDAANVISVKNNLLVQPKGGAAE
jgi:hyperosmotically inducible periplasmic protein